MNAGLSPAAPPCFPLVHDWEGNARYVPIVPMEKVAEVPLGLVSAGNGLVNYTLETVTSSDECNCSDKYHYVCHHLKGGTVLRLKTACSFL